MKEEYKEYFEEQLKDSEPLTEESIAALKQNRIDNGHSTASLDHIVPGDKFLYVMVERNKGVKEDGSKNLNINIEKITEREVDDFCKSVTFLEMTGKKMSLPRFKEK
jgi:hypothetical protein